MVHITKINIGWASNFQHRSLSHPCARMNQHKQPLKAHRKRENGSANMRQKQEGLPKSTELTLNKTTELKICHNTQVLVDQLSTFASSEALGRIAFSCLFSPSPTLLHGKRHGLSGWWLPCPSFQKISTCDQSSDCLQVGGSPVRAAQFWVRRPLCLLAFSQVDCPSQVKAEHRGCWSQLWSPIKSYW